ncbi:MAG: NifB/NifX family molybdenum-iron cluster-binding protein [Sedimentisphaerales bacterium]|nr:NifB/NifX family molybdenum-iron cluster-binding protein [Sedimentisphaerales bacterium]
MKVAVTSSTPTMDSIVDPRFGRAKHFILIDTETGDFTVHDNTQNLNATQGAGIQAAQNVAELDAQAIITGNVGPKAFKTLTAAGVKIFLCPNDTTVQQAIDQLKSNQLKTIEQANVEGHWI